MLLSVVTMEAINDSDDMHWKDRKGLIRLAQETPFIVSQAETPTGFLVHSGEVLCAFKDQGETLRVGCANESIPGFYWIVPDGVREYELFALYEEEAAVVQLASMVPNPG